MSGVTTPGTRPARLGKGEPPAGRTLPPQGSGHGSPLEYPTPLQAAPPGAGGAGAKGTHAATRRSAVPVGGTATGSDCRDMKGETIAIFLQNPVWSSSGHLNAGVKDESNSLEGVKPALGATSDLYFSEGGHHRKFSGKLFGKPNVCLLYTSPSPRDATLSRMPSSA